MGEDPRVGFGGLGIVSARRSEGEGGCEVVVVVGVGLERGAMLRLRGVVGGFLGGGRGGVVRRAVCCLCLFRMCCDDFWVGE